VTLSVKDVQCFEQPVAVNKLKRKSTENQQVYPLRRGRSAATTGTGTSFPLEEAEERMDGAGNRSNNVNTPMRQKERCFSATTSSYVDASQDSLPLDVMEVNWVKDSVVTTEPVDVLPLEICQDIVGEIVQAAAMLSTTKTMPLFSPLATKPKSGSTHILAHHKEHSMKIIVDVSKDNRGETIDEMILSLCLEIIDAAVTESDKSKAHRAENSPPSNDVSKGSETASYSMTSDGCDSSFSQLNDSADSSFKARSSKSGKKRKSSLPRDPAAPKKPLR
jgi:hypothetical protein